MSTKSVNDIDPEQLQQLEDQMEQLNLLNSQSAALSNPQIISTSAGQQAEKSKEQADPLKSSLLSSGGGKKFQPSSQRSRSYIKQKSSIGMGSSQIPSLQVGGVKDNSSSGILSPTELPPYHPPGGQYKRADHAQHPKSRSHFQSKIGMGQADHSPFQSHLQNPTPAAAGEGAQMVKLDSAYSTNRSEVSKVKDELLPPQSLQVAESQNKSAKGQDEEEPSISNFNSNLTSIAPNSTLGVSNFASLTETIFDHSKDNVKVCIRVRPLNEREKQSAQGKNKCVSVERRQQVLIDRGHDFRKYNFDFVGEEALDQQTIFNQIAKPIADSCIQGYNGTIFAYGQTGAGKTFTIQGPASLSADGSFFDQSEQRGIMQRSFEYIFQNMDAQTKLVEEKADGSELSFLIKCSYLEIYNEQIMDLLEPSSVNLHVREDIKKGVYVEGLQEEPVSTFKDMITLIQKGSKNRHVGATSMNRESSRSHSVLTTIIESKSMSQTGVWNMKTSRFHIIDLAGSERSKNTNTVGERLKEAGMINKSLSALGNVINSLVDLSEGKSRHVPYRDSKLTFILRDSLGGNSKTVIIANISPSMINLGETLSTLDFAKRAKQIKNKAIVNEDSSGTILVLKNEIRRLKKDLMDQSKNFQDLLRERETSQNVALGSDLVCSICKNSLNRSPQPTDDSMLLDDLNDSAMSGSARRDNPLRTSRSGQLQGDEAAMKQVKKYKERAAHAEALLAKNLEALATQQKYYDDEIKRLNELLMETTKANDGLIQQASQNKMKMKLREDKIHKLESGAPADEQVAILQAEIKLLNEKLDQQERDGSPMVAKLHSDCQALLLKNQKLEQELQGTNSSLPSLSAQVVQRQNLVNELTRYLNSKCSIQAYEQLEVQLKNSQKQQQTAAESSDKLREQIDDLQTRYDVLLASNVKAEEQNQRLTREFGKAQVEIQQLTHHYNNAMAYQRQNAEMQQLLEELEPRLQTQMKEISELQSLNEKLEQDLVASSEQEAVLKEALASSQASEAGLKQEIDNLEASQEQVELTQKQEKQALALQVEQLEKVNKEVRDARDGMETKISQMRATLELKEQVIAQKDEIIETKNQNIQNYKVELEKGIDESGKQVEALEKQLQSQKDSETDFKDQLEAMIEALASLIAFEGTAKRRSLSIQLTDRIEKDDQDSNAAFFAHVSESLEKISSFLTPQQLQQVNAYCRQLKSEIKDIDGQLQDELVRLSSEVEAGHQAAEVSHEKISELISEIQEKEGVLQELKELASVARSESEKIIQQKEEAQRLRELVEVQRDEAMTKVKLAQADRENALQEAKQAKLERDSALARVERSDNDKESALQALAQAQERSASAMDAQVEVQTQLEELKLAVQRVETEKTSGEERRAELEAESTAAQESQAAAEAQIVELAAQAKQLQDDLQTVQSASKSLEARFVASQEKLKLAEAERADLLRQLDEQESSTLTLQAELAQAQGALSMAKVASSSAIEEAEKATSSVQDKMKKQLEEKVNEMNIEMYNRLNLQKEKYKEQMRKFEEQVRTLHDKIDADREQYEQTIDQQTKEIEENIRELKLLLSEKQGLETQVSALKDQNKTFENNISYLDVSIEQMNTSMAGQKKEAEEQLALLKEQHAQEAEDFAEQKAALEEEIQKQSTTIEELQASLEDAEELQKINSELELKLDSAEAALQESQTRATDLLQEKSASDERLLKAEEELSRIQEKLASCEEALHKADQDLKTRFKETEGRDKENAEQSVLLMEAQALIDHKCNEVKQLQDRLCQNVDTIEEMKAQSQTQERDLALMGEEIASLQSKLAYADAQMDEKDREISRLESEKDGLQFKRDEGKKQLELKLKEMKTIVEDLSEQKAEAEEQLRQRMSMLEQEDLVKREGTQKVIDDLSEQKAQALKELYDIQKVEVPKLKLQIREANAQKDHLQQQLTKTLSELSELKIRQASNENEAEQLKAEFMKKESKLLKEVQDMQMFIELQQTEAKGASVVQQDLESLKKFCYSKIEVLRTVPSQEINLEQHADIGHLKEDQARLRHEVSAMVKELNVFGSNVSSASKMSNDQQDTSLQDSTTELNLLIKQIIGEMQRVYEQLLALDGQVFKREISTYNQELGYRETETKELREDFFKQMEQAVKQIEEKNAFFEQFQQETSALEDDLRQDIAGLSSEVDTLKTQNEAKDTEINRLIEEIGSLQTGLKNRSEKKQEVNYLEEELAKMRSEMTKMVQLEQNRQAQQEKTNQQAEAQKDDLINEIKRHEKALVDQKQLYEVRVQSQEQEIEQHQFRYKELETKLSLERDSYERRIGEVEKQADQFSQQIFIASKQREAAQGQAAQLQQTLHEARSREQDFASQTEAKQQELDGLALKYQSLEGEMSETRQSLKLYVEYAKSLEGDVQKLQDELERYGGHMNPNQKIQMHLKLKEEINVLSEKNSKLQDELAKKADMLSKQQKDFHSQQLNNSQEVSKAKADLDKLINHIRGCPQIFRLVSLQQSSSPLSQAIDAVTAADFRLSELSSQDGPASQALPPPHPQQQVFTSQAQYQNYVQTNQAKPAKKAPSHPTSKGSTQKFRSPPLSEKELSEYGKGAALGSTRQDLALYKNTNSGSASYRGVASHHQDSMEETKQGELSQHPVTSRPVAGQDHNLSSRGGSKHDRDPDGKSRSSKQMLKRELKNYAQGSEPVRTSSQAGYSQGNPSKPPTSLSHRDFQQEYPTKPQKEFAHRKPPSSYSSLQQQQPPAYPLPPQQHHQQLSESVAYPGISHQQQPQLPLRKHSSSSGYLHTKSSSGQLPPAPQQQTVGGNPIMLNSYQSIYKQQKLQRSDSQSSGTQMRPEKETYHHQKLQMEAAVQMARTQTSIAGYTELSRKKTQQSSSSKVSARDFTDPSGHRGPNYE